MHHFYEKSVRFLKSNYLIILCEISLLVLLILYRKGYLILGGEGNFFLNPAVLFTFDGYAWKSLELAGYPNPLINYSFLIFHFIAGLWKLGFSYNLINFILVYLAYSGPLLSMYWLARKVFKLNGFLGTLIALFYVLNPFSAFHIQEMMFWNIAPLVFLPIFFGIMYLNYKDNARLFLYAGIACLLGAFTFANIPYLGIFQIFILISLFVIPLLQEKKFKITEYLGKFVIVESAFVLFSSWWLFNLIRIQVQDIGTLYAKDFAVSWAKYAIGDGGIMQKLFSFKALIPLDDGTFLSHFYNSPLGNIIMVLPFLTLVYVLFLIKDKRNTRIISMLGLILLAIMFLNKGVNQPFSILYVWMLEKIPFFIIFKSPLEKFSVLFLFFFTITILVLMSSKKSAKILSYVFTIYVLFAAVPFISLKFMPDFPIGENKFVSRRFIFKTEYQQVIEKLNSDKLYYRYMSLPGSLNYQVTMANHDNKYYRGMDPILYAVNKPFIAAYSNTAFKVLYKNLSSSKIENIMGAFSIRKIMLNGDIIPSFGFLEKESPAQLKAVFSKTMVNEQFGIIDLYSLNSYVPLIYTPTREIFINNPSGNPANALSEMSSDDYKYGSVVFSENGRQSPVDKIIDLPEESRPTIEFKKINVVKYRVIVHNLKQEVPLIFNESFNKQWKLFLSPVQAEPSNLVSNSKSGRVEDGATEEELSDFINQKVVSKTVDDQGKSDFISKSFNKTIQNNNLDNGSVTETWFRNSIDDENHLEANGYANSWVIDPAKICSGNSKCMQNADGSYDIELVVEFWPQRLFYLGFFITGSTLLGCMIYMLYYWRKRKRSRNAV